MCVNPEILNSNEYDVMFQPLRFEITEVWPFFRSCTECPPSPIRNNGGGRGQWRVAAEISRGSIKHVAIIKRQLNPCKLI